LESSYLLPTASEESGTLIEHCARALDRSLKTGTHGLPLMGCGDWNDGMNLVGVGGKGESVWLAWFLYCALNDFKGLLTETDHARLSVYGSHMEKLKSSIQENAWDGNWYLRAFFDDGTPLGSASKEECKIDSIAQSWAVISGTLGGTLVGSSNETETRNVEKTRAVTAMDSVDEKLIDRQANIIKLFTPPFDKSVVNPGYIRGYLPGVRENGGQYTHAAAWTVIAFAALRDTERALPLFQLLNPINHSSTENEISTYKVEPYVVAGDVYTVAPHIGRGGWTWYTGSASWMYRAALESLLGFQLKGDRLQINPCLPRKFPEFQIIYMRGTTQFNIHVNAASHRTVEMDGVKLASNEIVLIEDGKTHEIRVNF
jgi:cyclic beta-1,2-glucan synthetase